jgi:hypothetical protein
MTNHGASQGPTPPRLFKEIFHPEFIEREKIVEKIVEVPVEKIVEVQRVRYEVPTVWEHVKILLKRFRDKF